MQVWRTPALSKQFAPFALHRTYGGAHDVLFPEDGGRPAFPDDDEPPPRDPRAARALLLERLSRNIQDAHDVLFPGETALRRDGDGDGGGGGGGGEPPDSVAF